MQRLAVISKIFNKFSLFFDLRWTSISIIFLVMCTRKTLQKRFFAFVFGKYVAPGMMKRLQPYKKQLFSSLKDIVSSDPKLKHEGCIRILEIGVGSGTNFQYYPSNSHLITLEPNNFFKNYFDNNRNKFPHIKIEKFLTGKAEMIPDIEDGTIDAVVSTLVLCSVDDISKVLREIKRVLCPGGKFYYLEHTGYERGTWERFLQESVEPFWQIISDGCRLCVPISRSIEEAGFNDVQEKEVFLNEEFFVVKRNVIGIAKA